MISVHIGYMYIGDYMKNNVNGPKFSEALAAIALIFLGTIWSYFSISNKMILLRDGVDPFIVTALHICGFIIISIGIFLLVYKLRINISFHKSHKKKDFSKKRVHKTNFKNFHKHNLCPNCGFELEEYFNFCPECGYKIEN